MAVTYSKPERVDLLTVRCRFQSDRTPPVTLRVGLNGLLARTIESADGSGSIDIACGPEDGPALEVLDHAAQRFAAAFDGRATLAWDRVDDAAYYRIDENSGGWTERTRVMQTGDGAYAWKTRRLDDGATGNFRVVPVGRHGQEWPEIEFSFLVVRVPDVPKVTYAYDSGSGNVTIAAA